MEVQPPSSWPVYLSGVFALILLLRNCCSVLFLLLISSCGLLCPTVAEPGPQAVLRSPYLLHFLDTHSGKRLDVVYRDDDGYNRTSLARLNSYLRDRRTSDVHTYDPRVFDLLHDLLAALGKPNGEIDVICGYRTPWTNEFLRTHGHHVARQSLHMQAMAIDIRIPGVPTAKLRDAALALHRGGVGYYAGNDFVHVDVGRVRRWVG